MQKAKKKKHFFTVLFQIEIALGSLYPPPRQIGLIEINATKTFQNQPIRKNQCCRKCSRWYKFQTHPRIILSRLLKELFHRFTKHYDGSIALQVSWVVELYFY